MLRLQLSIMQIWLPVKLGLIEKLFRVFEASFSSIDDLKKEIYGIQYLHARKVLIPENVKVSFYYV